MQISFWKEHIKQYLKRKLSGFRCLCHGLWNHQLLGCFFNNIFRLTAKKTPKLCITSPFWWVPIGFSSQRTSNAESTSMLWRDHPLPDHSLVIIRDNIRNNISSSSLQNKICNLLVQRTILPKFIYDKEGKLAGPTQILPVRVRGPALIWRLF